MNNTWIKRFMRLAKEVSSWSKDPSKKVGAVIVANDNDVLAVGFNGFPRGVEDTEERLCNRETKLALIVHAEANAIAASARNGRRLDGATIVVSSLFPCQDCAGLIAQSGIKRVIAPKLNEQSKWYDSNVMAKTIFDEAGVEVVEI